MQLVFERIQEESNKELGSRFESFCVDLLVAKFAKFAKHGTVQDGNFDLGFLVVWKHIEYNLRQLELETANLSNGKVIITTYHKMCNEIEKAIIKLQAKKIDRLEQDKFKLDFNRF
ncbi:4340_t:CDS:2 [Racocetra fulgida]|uniref:4340_t:CDS:1 n=1 Tax=Racocetra fulgida TaxID=60492 RepID=A0A9N9AIS4_9GLOM|nr:4340_t:CDS:2 [Racocetra fulgida]